VPLDPWSVSSTASMQKCKCRRSRELCIPSHQLHTFSGSLASQRHVHLLPILLGRPETEAKEDLAAPDKIYLGPRPNRHGGTRRDQRPIYHEWVRSACVQLQGAASQRVPLPRDFESFA
jgi:hypothetical protein